MLPMLLSLPMNDCLKITNVAITMTVKCTVSLQGKDPDTSNSAAYVSRDVRPAAIHNIRITDACTTVACAL